MNATFNFKLLTDTCCHGSNPKEAAEMRVPSIRGHVRRWHEQLFGKDDMEACWGTGGSGTPVASKVMLRVECLQDNEGTANVKILPHKNQGESWALCSGNCYALHVSFRNGASQEQPEHILAAIRLWLLMGTLGLRSNRAFGSVWPLDNPPKDRQALAGELKALGLENYAVAISREPQQINLAVCTDTLKGLPEFFGESSRNTRTPSPLKMKYISLGNSEYLILHAAKRDIIDGALKALRTYNKPLGTEITFDTLL